DCIGHAGTVYRYGGDEFAILLPGIALTQGVRIAKKVKMAVSAITVRGIRPTISCGAASYPTHGHTENAIYRAADKSLYRDKLKKPHTSGRWLRSSSHGATGAA